MKKLIYTTIVLLLTIAVFTTCETKDNTRGSIHGNIIDKTTGDAIPIANVRLLPGENSLLTGSNGFFQFENLADGIYTLSVSRDGYRTATVDGIIISQNSVRRDIALERIPAIVTVDRETLDFGSEASVTQLSFSLVNSSREDLAWSITTDRPWISNITPNSGTLEHGITQSVQVTIDRSRLSAGVNTTVLVIMSNNGRSEITLTAYRLETHIRITTGTVSNITQTSATISGRVFTSDGSQFGDEVPTAVWVYFGTNSNPTTGGTRISLPIPADMRNFVSANTTTNISNLTLGTTYYVQAFATNHFGTAYGEIIRFTTRTPYYTTGSLAVQWTDVSLGTDWNSADILCRESRVGGHSNWRLPTVGELTSIYALRNEIGGFQTTLRYWSSTFCGTWWDGTWSGVMPNLHETYYWVDFRNGNQDCFQWLSNAVRCVRTITP